MSKAFLSLFVAAAILTACSQKTAPAASYADEMARLCQLDVEELGHNIDLDMDISGLSLSDLRILRNAFAARQGYPFRDAYLRSVFQSTTWYDSLMYVFDETESNFIDKERDNDLSWREHYYKCISPEALKYSDAELAFIKRIQEREAQLLKQNFATGGDRRVNMGNLINPAQLADFPTALYDQLGRNGFAIVPAEHLQLFHVYEQNDYHEFPSFITTDLFLQLYHLYFDAMLREVEQHSFMQLIDDFCTTAISELRKQQATNPQQQLADAYEWDVCYFAIAQSLLKPSGRPSSDFTQKYREAAEEAYVSAHEARNATSEFLGYRDAQFEFSLFRPRGHYTRTDSLRQYFQAMMWLQTAPFMTDNAQHMVRALSMAELIGRSEKLTRLYRKLTEPMTYLMGMPDDVSLMQVYDVIRQTGLSTEQIISRPAVFKSVCQTIDDMAERTTRLRPKFIHSSRNKLRLMPQRYQPDAEVLLEMVDYKNSPTRRPTPMGLDVFAAMGNQLARQILTDEMGQAKQWDMFSAALQRMTKRTDSIDWTTNVACLWMDALKSVAAPAKKPSPYFMLTPEWGRKSLNAALASWAELKHDAILYAKQPMGAECGGGGVPAPVVKAYVEPCIEFWQKAKRLLEQTNELLTRYNLLTPRAMAVGERMAEEVDFLLSIAQKEMEGKSITDVEYDQLKYIGATFENMSLELIRNPEQDLWEWDDVQGPERCVALVADVYTANADNNPQKSVLYEGIGKADDLYVVIEVDGYLYLMRGAVFSYRELTRPYGEERLTDEQWQKMLESNPRLGVPEWMAPITVPLKKAPVDNEEVFYSSGC